MPSDDFPTLRGERVSLRVLRAEDAPAWHAGQDDEQRRWFQFPGPASLEDVGRAIEAWRASWTSGGPVRQWGIWVAGDDLAGGVEVRDRGDRRVNISYVVFPFARRAGIATEAARLAVHWAFANLDIDAVVAIVDERNTASLGVTRGAGFVADGPAESWEYGETGPMLRFVVARGLVTDR